MQAIGIANIKRRVICREKSILYFLDLNVQRFVVVDRILYTPVQEQTFPECKVDGLFSQSDIFRFLAANATWMKNEPLFQKSLSELNIGTTNTLSIQSREFAGTAFSILRLYKKSSAAVVDALGKLWATLSISDLKGINRKNSYVLDLPLDDFFRHDKKRGWWETPSTVYLDTSLYEAILQFNCSAHHILYVVDKDSRPVGEVSHHDILSKLASL